MKLDCNAKLAQNQVAENINLPQITHKIYVSCEYFGANLSKNVDVNMENNFNLNDFEQLHLFEGLTLTSLLNDNEVLMNRTLTREEQSLFFSKNVVEMKFYRLNAV
jgi:hypothetical protein